MEVITIESEAFKEIESKLKVIANFVLEHTKDKDIVNEDEIWVDSYDVCTFLKISDRTLQRLRSSGEIAYSTIRGRNFYKIGEIKRLLESRLIKSNHDNLQSLIKSHQIHVQERRDTKQDK